MAMLARLLRSHKAALPSWVASFWDPNRSVRPRELEVADFPAVRQNWSDADVQDLQSHSLNKLLNEVYAAEEAEDE